MAQLTNTQYPLPSLTFNAADWRNSDHEVAMRELLSGDKPVIKFSVADGFAYYLVVSMSPLKLQHIPYGDEYAVHDAMIRGLRKNDVENMLERQKRWNF